MLNLLNVIKTTLRKDLRLLRKASSKPHKIVVPHLEDDVLQGIDNGIMTPKVHPGRFKAPLVAFDDDVINTIKVILKDTITKNLIKDAAIFDRYIKGRHPPVTRADLLDKKTSCMEEVYSNMNTDPSKLEKEEEILRFEKLTNRKVSSLLKQRIYQWEPIDYTSYIGKQYLIRRMPAEYAALNKIFLEISSRHPDFKPHSLLDFGSGVGTVTSVVRKYWEDSVREYFNVDSSPEMHDIARLMLTNGDPEGELPIRKVFYRQFLPSKVDRMYSLVVCSYTLFDFSCMEHRLQTLMKLWNKTEDFFVIVEQGTKQGFKLINEARNFILQTDAASIYSAGIHVFAPCPHEKECPQVRLTTKPCCFRAHYAHLPIGRRQENDTEYFSYVVFKKGKRPETDRQWPRVIRPVLRKKKIAICHLCTKECKLRVMVFSKTKHGLKNYHVGRSVKVGDRLPMTFSECVIDDFDTLDGADMEVRDVESGEEIPDYDDVIDYEEK